MTRVLRPRSTDASRIPMEGWAARRIVVMAEERAKPELWTDSWRNWTSSGTPWQAAWDYWVDAAQRTVLFCDVMRKRGNMFLEHEAKGKPPVLAFEQEMVLDGRTLGRPVNYFLVRIIPPAGTRTDPRKRPFVVFDPRAGHGPGIGGSKVDSEIGVALLAGDLGNGRFDGVHLVANFENLNPANTLWKKPYNLYAKIDTEEPRYLDFERWWGGFFLLNEEEMRFIVNNLFVGNRLASGEIVTSAGRRIDLRNIRSPIIVFASWGDNITPPQQALNWILDCYATDRELLAQEQTIVYILHHDIGHLGIFVSGRIAQREHSEIVQALDVIETLPPGLWEMVIEDKQPGASHAELMPGRYLVRFERRSLNDIRALEDTREDERPFAAVARVSEIAESWYRTFVSPWIRPWVTEPVAEALRNLHPNRLQYSLCSDRNPWMAGVKDLADVVRQHRNPAAPENQFLAVEQKVSAQIEHALESYRDVRDRTTERLFNAIYGSAWLQAAVGLRAAAGDGVAVRPRAETVEALLGTKMAAPRMRVGQGGLREAAVRILLYAGSDEPRVDVRGFRMAEQVRDKYLAGERLPGPQRRELFREQFFLLLLDEAGALAALPRMLRSDGERATALEMVRQVLSAKGELSEERRARLARVERILNESPAIPAPVA